MLKFRSVFIIICFAIVVLVPWHSETIVGGKLSLDGNNSIHLSCQTSIHKGIEIYRGQDAIFFPSNDSINPMHISIQKLAYTNNKTIISSFVRNHKNIRNIKPVNGLLSIKGARESLLMRAMRNFF